MILNTDIGLQVSTIASKNAPLAEKSCSSRPEWFRSRKNRNTECHTLPRYVLTLEWTSMLLLLTDVFAILEYFSSVYL